MKVTFHITRPIRNPDGLQNFEQSARDWIATLIESLGDQLQGNGDGRIQMDLNGVVLEFRVTKIPGLLEIKDVVIKHDPPGSENRSTPLRYSEICHEIEDAPITYLGGLLACALRTCLKRQFFKSERALMVYVQSILDR